MAQHGAKFRLWIDGTEVNDALGMVRRVEVDEHTDELSTFRLVAEMAPTAAGDWDRLMDERFRLLRRVTIAFAVKPERAAEEIEEIVFEGYVTVVEPHYSKDRVPHSTLTISGLDASCLMHLEQRTRTWEGKSDAAIVRDILDEYGFSKAKVEDTSPQREPDRAPMMQRGTDAELIRHLARRHGFEAYVERTQTSVTVGPSELGAITGHFHLPKVDEEIQGRIDLFPKEAPTIIDMTASWESHRPTHVRGGHIDTFSRNVQAVEVATPRYSREGKSRSDILAARLAEVLPKRKTTGESDAPKPLRSVGLQYSHTPHGEPEVENLAWSELRDADWLGEATATVEGLRYPGILRARRPIELGGAGELLDGRWYVRTARHRWAWDQQAHAYRVELAMVRNTLGGLG